jgi:predicted glycogen debranching enzyme
MIVFNSTVCADFQAATSREWLETNGIGGFASGTISGANTRRYHAIFTPATEPPLGRITMLSKLEETVNIDGTAYELSSNQYPNRVHPQGFKYLKSFRLDPFPIWVYEIDGVEIEKKVFMVHGENAVVIRWQITRASRRDKRKISLEVRPLLSFVDYHSLRHADTLFDPTYTVSAKTVRMQPVPSMPPIFFRHDATRIEKTGYWYRNFEYAIEHERGFDYREDLFQPFTFEFDDIRSASLIVSNEIVTNADVSKLERDGDQAPRRSRESRRGERRVHQTARAGRGPVHRPAWRRRYSDRGISVVLRLGTRHDDRFEWADACNRTT